MKQYNALEISRGLLWSLSTSMFRCYEERIPKDSRVLVVSNHRSFMDAPVIIAALDKPVRFACHYYMSQVPILREIVLGQMGCFPLEVNSQRSNNFFQQSQQLLQAKEIIGVFPEGTQPMVNFTNANQVGKFQRGFAHLALRADVEDLIVLPIAIASLEEVSASGVPLQVLSLFDQSEPLFKQQGWHPVVIYRSVGVLIGRPYLVTAQHREKYRGKKGRSMVAEITDYCQSEITDLLRQGC